MYGFFKPRTHRFRNLQDFRPIRSALLYVPGGKASYPSSVLMAAGPAIACQVKDLFLTTPSINGVVNHLTIAAAKVAGIKKIAKLGVLKL